MPLMPRKVKYRKSQRGSRAGNANRGTKLSFGDYGLQTLDTVSYTHLTLPTKRIV